jgi:two-component system OmpR family sensor kinase
MFKTLYSKLAIVLTGLFCIVGLIFVAITIFSTDMYQQEVNQKLNDNLAQHIVNEKLLIQNNRVNEDALKNIFHMLMVINPSIEIYLLDTDGNILAFSAPPGKVKRQRIDTGPIKSWLKGDRNQPILGEDPRNQKGKKVFTAAPIFNDDRLEGYLYVILGGEIYDSIAQKLKRSFIIKLSFWVIWGSLLFALVTGLILFAMLTERLKKLTNSVDSFRLGEGLNIEELPIRKKGNLSDEIDRLSVSFKVMAEQIQSQMEKLQKSDSMRRELVANVSHDLRTPLATLQGYIETLLLKEESLTGEERRKYLEIAIKHCVRLNRLVNDLFELAKLDSGDMKPRPESFNIIDLIQDLIQKFQLKAKEKDIKIDVNTRKELSYVFADIALIERALENLIENAIHYTDMGGTIELILEKEEEDISIGVRNSGKIIPDKDIPLIFDRFYQLNRSSKDKIGHSGLGLAITKKIIELHKRIIEVESSSDTGTYFHFRLPVYIHR